MSRVHRKFIVQFMCSLLIFSTSIAQVRLTDSSVKHSLSLIIRENYGTFIADLPKLQYVQDRHTSLMELDLSSQTTGSSEWQQETHYPEPGLAFLYGQSGANKYIGHIAAVMPFISFHLHESAIASFNLRLGFGAAWVQRIFNPATNYQNLILGSHINAAINGMLTADIHVLPRTSLAFGLSFLHLSNGSLKLPNLGLNIPMASAGLRYDIVPASPRIKRTLPALNKKIYFYLYSFVAAKQSFPLKSAVYLVNIFNGEAMKAISRTSRIGAGVNLTIDRANSTEVPNSPTFAFDRHLSHLQAALYIGYEYMVGKLSFPVQVGYYLYNQYPVNLIYEMMGVKYRFAHRWTAGLALKAHLGNGDFVQWGLGYRF